MSNTTEVRTRRACDYCGLVMDDDVACTLPTYDGLHHPGCDSERCPDCGGQAISCECTYEDE